MRRVACVAILLVALTPLSSPAAPTKRVDPKILEAFRVAAAKRGCQAVPYKKDRDDCETRSLWQDRACGHFGCVPFEDVEDLVEALERTDNQIHAHGERGGPDNSHIEGLRDRRKRLIADLEKHLPVATERKRVGERCAGARKSVADLFGEMVEKVDKEPEHGDRWMKSYKHDILEHFHDQTPNHLNQIRDVTNAVRNCERIETLLLKTLKEEE